MIPTEIVTVGIMRQNAEQQHLAQRHIEQPGQCQGSHAGHGHTMPHSREIAMAVAIRGSAVPADPLGKIAGQAER